MAFNEVKARIEHKVKPELTKTPEQGLEKDLMKVKYAFLTKKLDKYTNGTVNYMASLRYAQQQGDTTRYLNTVDRETNKLLKDNKVMSFEFSIYSQRLQNESKTLFESIAERQRQIEVKNFRNAQVTNAIEMGEGKFQSGITRLQEMKDSLSPINTTGIRPNYGELGLRLDLRIQQEINALKNKSKEFKEKFVKGNYLDGGNVKYYIHGVDKSGNVLISTYSYTHEKIESKDEKIRKFAKFMPKRQEMYSSLKPTLKFGKMKKVNWLSVNKDIGKKYQLNKFEPFKNNFTGKVIDGKGFSIDGDPQVMESKGRINEIAQLKQINFIYSGRFIDSLTNPTEFNKMKNQYPMINGIAELLNESGGMEILEKALEQNLNSMGLYFKKEGSNVIPTDIFRKSTPKVRAQALSRTMFGAFQKFQVLKQKNQLSKLEKGKEKPHLQSYLRAELAYNNGNFIKAYAHFMAYKSKVQGKPSLDDKERRVVVKMKMKACSLKLIDVAEKVVAASVSEKMGQIEGGVRKKTYKQALAVLNKMRGLLKSNPKIYTLDSAYRNVPDKPMLTSSDRLRNAGNKNKLSLAETRLRVTYMPFIFKLMDLSHIESDSGRKDKLFQYANTARKNKFRKVAGVLYKHYIKDELRQHKENMQKNPEHWKKVRETYRQVRIANTEMTAKPKADFIKTKHTGEKATYKRLALAKKAAIQVAGGLGLFNAMDEKAQKQLVDQLVADLNQQAMDDSVDNYVFKDFMKAKGEKTKGAKEFINMTDYFDEWFTLSDEGADTAKYIASEAAVMIATLGASYGVGSAVRAATLMKLRSMAGKFATNIIVRGATRGAAFAAEAMASEAFMRAIRTAKGEKGLFGPGQLKEFIVHSMVFFGVMGAGRRGLAPLMQKMMQMKKGGKFASNAVSILGFEAPAMTTLSSLMDPHYKGSWLANYGQSLMGIMYSRIGIKLFNSSTGNAVLKYEMAAERRAKMLSNPDFQKVRMQIKSKSNKKFVEAVRANVENGTKIPRKYRKIYDAMIQNLKSTGMNKADAIASFNKLAFGKFSKSKAVFGNADGYTAFAAKIEKGKSWLSKKENAKKVKSDLSNPKILAIFKGFMNMAKGNYAKFKAKYPRLAEQLPVRLRQLGGLSLTIIAGAAGMGIGLVKQKERIPKTPQEAEMMRLQQETEMVNTISREKSLDMMGYKEGSKARALAKETFFDKATGLMNRNGLALMNNMIQKGQKISVVSYDGDHFKGFNEVAFMGSKGRANGDRVIKLYSKGMNEMINKLRGEGYEVHGVRMGGEEIVIFGNVPQKKMHSRMEQMTAKLKKEIRSTLTPDEMDAMALYISRGKYKDKDGGYALAKREIGGSTAAVVYVDGKLVRGKKDVVKKILLVADEFMEQRKNHVGRGRIVRDTQRPHDFAKSLDKPPKNSLNSNQNKTLYKEGDRLFNMSDKLFKGKLAELNKLKLNAGQNEKLIALLKSPDTKISQIKQQLVRFGIKGNTRQLAKQLQKEYLQTIRDYGTYTGTATMTKFQREITKETGKFNKKNVWELEIGEFKSMNENLGHTGGDIFLTKVNHDVISHTIGALGIPKSAILVAQRGASFRFTISTAYLKANPGLNQRFMTALSARYRTQLIKFYKGLNDKARNQEEKFGTIRTKWIEDNKQENTKSHLRDQFKLLYSQPT